MVRFWGKNTLGEMRETTQQCNANQQDKQIPMVKYWVNTIYQGAGKTERKKTDETLLIQLHCRNVQL